MIGAPQNSTTVGQRLALAVSDIGRGAHDVAVLRLENPTGRPLPAWDPGAHIDVVLPSGRIRQYSLCGDPDDRAAYTIAVLREETGRGGSREIHDAVLPGRELLASEPRNHFPLVPATDYVLIAGGIGITPILAMCRTLQKAGRRWVLYYGGRTRSSMAFVDELLALDPARVHVQPEDEVGLLDLEGIARDIRPGTEVFCCGPEGLLTASKKVVSAHLPHKRVHMERFTAGATIVDGDPGGNRTFDAELRRSRLVVTVPPDRTLLEAVTEVVPTAVSSCEEGFCGTCETRVLDGVPDHRDTILSDEERARGDRMYICVSRAKSRRLVLDL